MISTPDRQNTIALIEQAKAAGARRAQACAEVGIDERTCRRWRAMDGTPEDRRPTAPRPVPRNHVARQSEPGGARQSGMPEQNVAMMLVVASASDCPLCPSRRKAWPSRPPPTAASGLTAAWAERWCN